jgi:hypothetical protein
MLGKLPSQLLRLSAIIHNIHEAFNYVSTISSEKKNLTPDFALRLEEHFKTINSFTVSGENLVRGYNILEFFNKTKLVLAGFECGDWELSIEDIFKSFLNPLESVQQHSMILNNNQSIDTEKGICKSVNLNNRKEVKQKIMAHILLTNELEFNGNKLNQSFKGRGCRSDVISEVFKELSNHGYGEHKKASNKQGFYL